MSYLLTLTIIANVILTYWLEKKIKNVFLFYGTLIVSSIIVYFAGCVIEIGFFNKAGGIAMARATYLHPIFMTIIGYGLRQKSKKGYSLSEFYFGKYNEAGKRINKSWMTYLMYFLIGLLVVLVTVGSLERIFK